MNNISQSEILPQDANNKVNHFLQKFHVAEILKQCNGYKQKGFSAIQLFTYLLALMFQPLSTYMSMRVGAYKVPFSKNTIRRFCNKASINWHKLLRILTLLWTDGYSNVPVDFAPLSSGNEELIVSPAKLVYVRNKANKKDWIAIISTDTSLSEEEIIRRYGYRWNIEVYFKTCKQYLKYTSECQSTSFDSLTAHLAIANVRYMMLSMFQRANTDHRSLGELFYLYVQEVAEITFDHSMKLIMIALLSTVKNFFGLTEEQMSVFVQEFIGNLPAYLRTPLEACAEQLVAV